MMGLYTFCFRSSAVPFCCILVGSHDTQHFPFCYRVVGNIPAAVTAQLQLNPYMDVMGLLPATALLMVQPLLHYSQLVF